MRPRLAAMLFGAGAALAGAGLAYAGEWGAGIAVVSMGAAVVLLVRDRDVPPDLPLAVAVGALRAQQQLLDALKLRGKAVVEPPSRPDAAALVFVPADETEAAGVGRLDPGQVFQREHGGAIGVLLPNTAAGLEESWGRMRGMPAGQGDEEAILHVRGALRALQLGADVTFARGGNGRRVVYRPLALAELCRAARERGPLSHEQAACPTCTLIAILFARAHGKRVRFVSSAEDEGRVMLSLEVTP